MQDKAIKQSKQPSLDDKMTILANFFIDRIIEEHEKKLKLKQQTATISSGAPKQ